MTLHNFMYLEFSSKILSFTRLKEDFFFRGSDKDKISLIKKCFKEGERGQFPKPHFLRQKSNPFKNNKKAQVWYIKIVWFCYEATHLDLALFPKINKQTF